jgi:hypothetical protein
VPLLYQQSGCATYKATVDTTWKNYGVSQSRGALPHGPMVIFVHMASVWVPFTSESKEAIADYDEIRKEITLALRECGRRLGVFLRRRGRAQSEFRRRNIFELYIEEVAEACNRLKGGKLATQKLKEQLQKIATSKTGGMKTDELLGKTGAGPEGLPDSIIVTEEGVEGDVGVAGPATEPAAAPEAAKRQRSRVSRSLARNPGARPPAPRRRPRRSAGRRAEGSHGKSRTTRKAADRATDTKTDRAPKKKRTKAASSVETKLVGMADVVIQAAQRSRDPGFEIPIRALSNVSFNPRKGMIVMGQQEAGAHLLQRRHGQEVHADHAGRRRTRRAPARRSHHFAARDLLPHQAHDQELPGEHLRHPGRDRSHHRRSRGVALRSCARSCTCAPRTVAASSGRWCWATTATAWTAHDSARAATPSRRSSSRSTSTSRSAPPTSSGGRKGHAVEPALRGQVLEEIQLRAAHRQRPAAARRAPAGAAAPRGKNLPVYVLVDNDPWGYYIYSVVKQGSINLAFESERMAIPKAKFIGLSSADPERYELPRNVGIKLNDKDVSRAKELLNYAWFQKKDWQQEIKRMLSIGLKYELDALANKDFQYLTKTYLPRKLKEEDWLD